MNYKFNITQLDDHVGNGMLRYALSTVIAPDYFASVNYCTLYTLHLYSSCDGDPLIPSSF